MTAPYHEIAAINWSILRNMRRSPKHFRHAEMSPSRADSDTFRFGRLVHTLVLEPSRLEHEYVVWDLEAAERTAEIVPKTKGPAPKITAARRGKIWETFEEQNSARTIIPREMLDTARAAADSVLEVWTPDERRECAIEWVDTTTGLRCKGRVDSIGPDSVTELKTSRDISLGAMSRQMHALDYHCQLAHYRAGIRALTGRSVSAHIVAVEAVAPHDVAVFAIDEEALIAAEVDVLRMLERVAECRASGRWPGRYTEPQTLALPGWLRERDDNDITDLGLHFGDGKENEL